MLVPTIAGTSMLSASYQRVYNSEFYFLALRVVPGCQRVPNPVAEDDRLVLWLANQSAARFNGALSNRS